VTTGIPVDFPVEVELKHFSEEAWADFVRDLVAPTMRTTMQQHINHGCAKCQSAMQVWQHVLSIAKAESALTPPDDVVRISKSQFAGTLYKAKHGIHLLFDSSLELVAAGLRGSVSARQFLYETDDYYIDLRLEPRRDADSACLVGQVLSRSVTERAAQKVPVRLRQGTRSLAETATNQFGEFQLEFDASQNLWLAIGHDEADEIILPLYGVHKPSNRKDLA
jgi:hypothetical protein